MTVVTGQINFCYSLELTCTGFVHQAIALEAY